MARMTRRKFLAVAASSGASLALGLKRSRRSGIPWAERRDLYPQGVASGDPHPDSVMLWTRRPPADSAAATRLFVEVAEDPSFHRVVTRAQASVSATTDWTCRVLAAGLEPARVYWYRFTDEQGQGSRVGRTITAPSEKDARPVSFAFVSCQNMQQGAGNAYRRMIWEDENKPAPERLGFVLHLGDFIYEVVWYPEDRPQGMYARRLRDIVRFRDGEKISDYHIPVSLDDYRAVYRAYLLDADLQDARARWPFVCMWDNHEFSWKGWQTLQNFGGVRPAQTRKVAANQAWFEYQPARVVRKDPGRDRFEAPAVTDAPVLEFDEQGLGREISRWTLSASRDRSSEATAPTEARSPTESGTGSSDGVPARARDWSARLSRERPRSYSEPSRTPATTRAEDRLVSRSRPGGRDVFGSFPPVCRIAAGVSARIERHARVANRALQPSVGWNRGVADRLTGRACPTRESSFPAGDVHSR